MHVSPQLLDYKFVLITPQTSVIITCSIQPTGVVTMAMRKCYKALLTCTFMIFLI